MEDGAQGKGTLVSAGGHVEINEQPVLKMVLDLEVPGMEPRRIERKVIVSDFAAPLMQPGLVLPVYVNPRTRRTFSSPGKQGHAMSAFRPVDPKQSFPELEQSALERWREDRTFGAPGVPAARRRAEIWSFYDGPPTANGKPGSHHVLARAFKDIYPRYQAMRGHYVPRKAGWDCHGLPVELEVEKELGIASKAEIEEYGVAEFNAKCRESVFRYVEVWNRLTERIGFWVDLDDPYVT